MDLQDKKIQSETKIKNLSDNIEQRTKDVMAFLDNMHQVTATGWPPPGGWETWLSTRLIGIEAAKKILSDEYKNKDNIEKAIIVAAKQKEKARIKAEADAAKKLKEEKEAAAAIKAAEKVAEKAAEEEADRLKAEEEAKAAIKVAKEAEKVAKEAERVAKIAEFNVVLNETVPDTRQNRHNKILILIELFKLGGISKTEMYDKRRIFVDPNIPL